MSMPTVAHVDQFRVSKLEAQLSDTFQSFVASLVSSPRTCLFPTQPSTTMHPSTLETNTDLSSTYAYRVVKMISPC